MRNHVPAETDPPEREVFLLEQRLRYEYAAPVRRLRHRLVVVPRGRHGAQVRTSFGHDVQGADATSTITSDRFGNHVIEVGAAEVEAWIEFRVWCRVTRRGRGQSAVATAALGDARWRRPTHLTESDAAMDEAAGALAVGVPSHGREVEVAERICAWTHDSFTYGFGTTGVRTTAAQALAGGRGVCQDYAHVMIAVCRRAGIAARYASGHLVGEGGSHAWVEILAPTIDGTAAAAVAFDPTHRRRVGAGYLTIAVGRDYSDVAPTSGTFEGTCTGVLRSEKRLTIADERVPVRLAG